MKEFSVVVSKLEYATIKIKAEDIDDAVEIAEAMDMSAIDDWHLAECDPYAVEQVDEIADDTEEDPSPFISPTISCCNKMIDMWDELREKVFELPEDDIRAFILLWQNHFEKYGDAITEFSLLKQDIDKKKLECMAVDMLMDIRNPVAQ